ncbi:MAM and LDL-receptor class A domain-containing protein 1 [Exaiptasia diaphana]|uniref:MAM domain-containing protein n=1 Tax=Exaiptasia diaphana TaxID=2652724 RepID=A0A913YSM4_EXADI|nr:MAM and LDL-receptor class A domain-containing protein 1 [Exaiptasia diaphana]
MSCTQQTFTWKVRDDLDIGLYSLKIAYNSSSEPPERTKKVGEMRISSATIKECNFVDGICSWMKVKTNIRNCWKRHETDDIGYIVIDGKCSAMLETDLLPWHPVFKKTGLCLRLSYLMNSTSKSWLSVSKVTVNGEAEILWNATGYHGAEWKQGSVPLHNETRQKIQLYGKGDVNGNASIAVASINIITEKCSTLPYYATPGLKCKDDQFQCDNKECKEKEVRCNGDYKDCVDKSDEKDCVCPSNQFLCSSKECIIRERLCDGPPKDCKDGFDEIHCFPECKDKYQCVGGTCIDWLDTCNNETFHCPDSSHNPSICDNTNCTLRDIGCESLNNNNDSASKKSQCRTFSMCSFESGLCGLKNDQNVKLRWIRKEGKTKSQNTGPSFDHTSRKGKYVYIESSGGNTGDKARLASDWLRAEEPLCLQFWYHMFGKDIVSLRILMKTNLSETSVWLNNGSQNDEWKFGQTPLNPDGLNMYKIIFEGEIDGDEGDIAIDDIRLEDGLCLKHIEYSRFPPYCCIDFEWNKHSSSNCK